MPSRVRNASAFAGTAITPVAQLLNEKRPGNLPSASRFAAAFGKQMRNMEWIIRQAAANAERGTEGDNKQQIAPKPAPEDSPVV